MRGITKGLAEGVECKEILIERNKQLRIKDSIVFNREQKIVSLSIVDTAKSKIIAQHQSNEVKTAKKIQNKNSIILSLIFAVLIETILIVK